MTSNENHTFSTINTPFRKRMAVGAVTVMTAGSLLGMGVAGASAAPAETSTATHSSATADTHADAGAAASLPDELRTDMQGATRGDRAQNVSGTLAEHPEVFQSLPANLQADLTALNDADSDRAAVADKIEATALAGGYGVQIQNVATAIQQNPEHPIGGAVHALAGSEAVSGSDTQSAAEKIATRVTENPALFAQLPAQLQADLTELQTLPEADRAAAAELIQTTAGDGGYGQQVQKVTETIKANLPGGTADAEATGSSDSGTVHGGGAVAGNE